MSTSARGDGAGSIAQVRPAVGFDPAAVRAWLNGQDPDEPGERQAERYLYPADDPGSDHDSGGAAVVLDDAERLVDEAGRAGLFGPDVRIGLWLDRKPADAGPAIGWHLTVEITTPAPGGDVLRFAARGPRRRCCTAPPTTRTGSKAWWPCWPRSPATPPTSWTGH